MRPRFLFAAFADALHVFAALVYADRIVFERVSIRAHQGEPVKTTAVTHFQRTFTP